MSAIFISHSSRDNDASATVRAFLNDQGYNSIFLDFDPADGIPAGRSWEQELYAQLRGCRAVIVLCSPHSMESDWCFAEITHAKSMGKHVFPVKIADCDIRSVLLDHQVIDMTADQDDALARLGRGLIVAGLDPKDMFQWDGKRPVYPGLLAFQEEDAAIYFGRDDEIQDGLDVLNRLSQFGGARLMMVLGASGSGKSSLVRAGIAPRLKRDPERWIVAPPFRPFDNPMRELAVALADLSADLGAPRTWRQILETLQGARTAERQAKALVELAEEMRIDAKAREAHLILLVDQFEELLGTAGGEDGAATGFLRMLVGALAAPNTPLMAIGTLRSDFLGQYQTEPVLLDLPYEPLTVGAMSKESYAQVIEGPAAIAGIELESGLVQAMVDDTGANDALPLLAFTLRELNERYGDDNLLTLDEYKALGRLEGSVAKAAEGVMAATALSEQEMDDLRTAFTSMVRINEKGEFSRRVAKWGDMPARAQPIQERFIEARLLVSMQNEGDRTLEVSHEALFRTWQQLSRWLDDDRENILLRDGVHQAALEWDEAGRDPVLLVHRGGRLESAEALLRQPRFEFQPIDRAYLEACIDERNAVVAAQEAAARAKRRRLVFGLGAVAVVSVIVAGLSLYTLSLSEQFDKTKREARLLNDAKALREQQALNESNSWSAMFDQMRANGVEIGRSNACGKGALYALPGNLESYIDLYGISQVAGVDVFVKGPHLQRKPGSNVREYDCYSHEFGHYNPAFVDWLTARADKTVQDLDFIKETADFYRDQMQGSVVAFLNAYDALTNPANAGAAQEAVESYQAALAQLTPEDAYNQKNSPLTITDFQGLFNYRNYEGAFWLRRTIDGTARNFCRLLTTVHNAYSPDRANEHPELIVLLSLPGKTEFTRIPADLCDR